MLKFKRKFRRQRVQQLPASRTPKAWGKHERNVVPTGRCHSSHGESIAGSCSTHVPPTCDIPFRRYLSICDLLFFGGGDTSSLECIRTDQVRSKSWNLPLVKKSQLCRKKCWSVRCRTLRRGFDCLSGKKDIIWLTLFSVRNFVRILKMHWNTSFFV